MSDGIDWGQLTKDVVLPAAVQVGSEYYKGKQQKKMMRGIAEAQQKSYDQYLSSLNPPEAVKQARYNQLASHARTQAQLANRRISDRMGARGIRGRGAASPIADTARTNQDALNAAYFQVFGNYNVPGMPPPVGYTPGTSQLMGSGLADTASAWATKKLFS